MPKKYAKRKAFKPEELREACVQFLYFGLEAKIVDIAEVLGITKRGVYKIIKRLSKR